EGGASRIGVNRNFMALPIPRVFRIAHGQFLSPQAMAAFGGRPLVSINGYKRESDRGDGVGCRKERVMKVSRRHFLRLAGSLGVSSLLVGYPVMIERNLVMVNRYRIPVP